MANTIFATNNHVPTEGSTEMTQQVRAPNPVRYEPLVHTVKEAAELLGVGRTTVYALIRSGRLPVVKIGRRTVIRRETLRVFLQFNER